MQFACQFAHRAIMQLFHKYNFINPAVCPKLYILRIIVINLAPIQQVHNYPICQFNLPSTDHNLHNINIFHVLPKHATHLM